ncbi:MAG: GLUG motif-containing protein, partial [Candidatus Saliniplasma sp.]
IDNAQEPAPGLQHVDDIDYFLPVDPDTKSQPYRIENWNHLNKVRIRPGASYKLVTNLDEYSQGYEEVASKMARDGDGFKPIRFTGVFDGQGFEIRDLYINRSDEKSIGLFGRSEGKIKDLGIVDANVGGKSRVGALVGWQGNGATVENCYATGEVIGPDDYNISEHVGGLIGVNSNGASVSNSYTVCNVSGVDNIGGLIGYQRNDGVSYNSYAMGNVNGVGVVGGLIGSNSEGTVEKSFATGNVVGEWKVGGLIGENNMATLSKSYATGDVSGNEYIGGLVGDNNFGIVDNTYSTGNVNGDENVGGLVGRNWAGGEVDNSFWDVEASGLDDSNGGTGLTTDEMAGESAPNNMEGFDFEETWETVVEDDEDSAEDGYPILQDLDREDQLRAQDVYQEKEDEDDGIPSFTLLILVIGTGIGVAIYHKKKLLNL